MRILTFKNENHIITYHEASYGSNVPLKVQVLEI